MSREWTIWRRAKFKFEGLGKNQNAGLVVVNIVDFVSMNLILTLQIIVFLFFKCSTSQLFEQ